METAVSLSCRTRNSSVHGGTWTGLRISAAVLWGLRCILVPSSGIVSYGLAALSRWATILFLKVGGTREQAVRAFPRGRMVESAEALRTMLALESHPAFGCVATQDATWGAGAASGRQRGQAEVKAGGPPWDKKQRQREGPRP